MGLFAQILHVLFREKWSITPNTPTKFSLAFKQINEFQKKYPLVADAQFTPAEMLVVLSLRVLSCPPSAH